MRRNASERGLTLVEMIAVLFILALVAGMAITSTEGLVDRSRYDASSRQMAELRGAIVGTPGNRSSDGSAVVSGFVADVGRLPKIFLDPNPALLPDADFSKRGPRLLRELWEQGSLPTYTVSTVQPSAGDDYGDLRVGAGWRGPYIQPQSASGGILDGWGLFLRIYAPSSVPSSTYDPTLLDGQDVGALRSWGANRSYDSASDTFDVDQELVIHRTAGSPIRSDHLGNLSVNVNVECPSSGTFYVVLRLYGPDSNGMAASIYPFVASPSLSYATIPVSSTNARTSIPILLENCTVGPRVLCAYRSNQTPTTEKQPIYDAMNSTRAVLYITVVPGTSTIALTIP